MPDPVWSSQYNYGQTPENNGFTRELYGSASLNLVTGGQAANRRVEVTSQPGGGYVFTTSNVPSLDGTIGATGEAVCNPGSGAGHCGFEMTFLDRAVFVQIFADRVEVECCGDPPNQHVYLTVQTASNVSDLTWRFTYAAGQFKVYRSGVLVADVAAPVCAKPFQRFLWWAEGSGSGVSTQTFRALRLYTGGAVQPG
jgi:hypothetical protein